MMSTEQASCAGALGAAENCKPNEKTNEQKQIFEYSEDDENDKENSSNIISENVVADDLISNASKPSVSDACAPSCGDKTLVQWGPQECDAVVPNLPEECDDVIPLESSPVCRLPSSGTVDDLEELTNTYAPSSTMPPMMAPISPLAPPAHGAASEDVPALGGDDSRTSDQVEVGFRIEETAMIFDWDDTLLPSTWVQRQGLTLCDSTSVNAWQKEQLDEVARAAEETLRLAMQFGEVVFVTNAEHGWVPLSCQKFMPSLWPLVEGIRVLSARTTYETPSCRSPLEWKVRAFEDEIGRLYGFEELKDATIRKNVIGLGDSVHEREALLRSTAGLPNCRSKSLKFVERPDIAQLLKQHSLVTSCFNQIVDHDGNLDLLIRCN